MDDVVDSVVSVNTLINGGCLVGAHFSGLIRAVGLIGVMFVPGFRETRHWMMVFVDGTGLMFLAGEVYLSKEI